MDKKGMEQETLMALIIMAIIFGVLVISQGIIFAETKGAVEDTECWKSIKEADLLKRYHPIKLGQPGISIDCPRKITYINKSEVVKNGVINQDKAHDLIANSLAQCWWKVGAGTRDPFTYWEEKDITYCLVCDTILYDQDLIEFIDNNQKNIHSLDDMGRYQITAPWEYLATHNVKEDKDLTYFGYLYPGQGRLILSEDDKRKLGGTIFIPGSVVLVQMYRPESKSVTWTSIGVLVLTETGIAVLTGGSSLITTPFRVGGRWVLMQGARRLVTRRIVSTAAGVGVEVIPGIAVRSVAGGTAKSLLRRGMLTSARFLGSEWGRRTVGIAVAAFALGPASNAFLYCDQCEGFGGISLITPDMDFDDQVPANLLKEDGKMEEKQIPRCSQIVN